MDGFNEFAQTIGKIPLFWVITAIIGVWFIINLIIKVWHKISEISLQLVQKKEEIKKAMEISDKYTTLKTECNTTHSELRESIETLSEKIDILTDEIQSVEKDRRERDLNKLRDRLIDIYLRYGVTERNPEKKWNKLESESFWSLFKDYEKLGGDGYIHQIVEPAMRVLTVESISVERK